MKRFFVFFLAMLLAMSSVLTSCDGAPGAKGEKGDVGEKGETGEKGEPGEKGDSITVVSCEKTGSEGLIDTYTITFSDGTTTEFQVTNSKPSASITDITYNEIGSKYVITYSDETSTEFSLSASSEIAGAYTDAVSKGFEGTESEFVINAINIAKTAFLGNGSPVDAKVFGAVIPQMMNKYNTYYVNDYIKTDLVSHTVTETVGYMDQTGKVTVKEGQNYVYTDIVPCNPGDTVQVIYNGTPLEFRFITAFKDGNHVGSVSVNCNNLHIDSYVVPEGVNGVVFTYHKKATPPQAVSGVYEIASILRENVTVSKINQLYYGNSGSGAQTVVKNEIISATKDTLKAGEYLTLESNQVMNNKNLTLSFKIDSMSDTDVIRLGHGETSYGGSYVELTKNNVKVINYSTSAGVSLNKAHGLTLAGTVNIIITTHLHNADITVSSGGNIYTTTVSWSGRNGAIFATTVGADITDVRMHWTCTAYNSDIWMLGDSYFNCGSPGRWPHYLRENGYTENYMLTGYPGRNSKTGLEDFKVALTHGTPKYAIWCLGMNDPDKTAINASYLESVQEFIRLCEENGITPILSTIPNTPTMNNSYKNDWVKKSGYRYIDFARAVGAEEVGSAWYEGMLHTDNVHPSELGAVALYSQFIADFPEILKDKKSN